MRVGPQMERAQSQLISYGGEKDFSAAEMSFAPSPNKEKNHSISTMNEYSALKSPKRQRK